MSDITLEEVLEEARRLPLGEQQRLLFKLNDRKRSPEREASKANMVREKLLEKARSLPESEQQRFRELLAAEAFADQPPGRFADCVQVIETNLNEFFTKPLSVRLRELPKLLVGLKSDKEEKLTAQLEELARKFEADEMVVRDEEFGPISIDPSMAERMVDDRIRRDLDWAFRFLLYQLMVEALVGRNDGIGFQTEMRQVFGFEKPAAELTNIISQMVEGPIKVRLESPGRGGSKADCDLTKLDKHYQQVYPMWKAASSLYHQSQRTKNTIRCEQWHEAIRAKYSDLPVDLIERLKPMHDWPVNIANTCLKQGGENTPEDIALEHAARLCGAPDYEYKLSTLSKYLERQRRVERHSDE